MGRDRKHSKVLQKLVDENEILVDYFADSDGHWLQLKEGYIFSWTQVNCTREDTVKEILQVWRAGYEKKEES